MITRRFFTKGMVLLSLVAGSFSTMGFSCAGLMATITGYVGAGIDAVTSVVNLLAGAGIVSLPEGMLISVVLNSIKVAWADVAAAVADYNNAPVADKLTWEGKVATALLAVQSEINKFWSDLHIPDAHLANTIAGLLGLVVSTIAGFIAALPHPQPVGPPPVSLKKTLAIAPKRLTQAQFRSQFNAILASSGHSQYSI